MTVFIKTIATIVGLVAIVAPALNVIRLAYRVKGRSSGGGKKLRTWPGVVLLTVGLVGIGIVLQKPIPIVINDGLPLVLLLAGAVIYFAGTGMYLWGLVTLRSMFGISSHAGAELYADHELITHGPFTLVRHPMYLGVLLASWGGLLIYRT